MGDLVFKLKTLTPVWTGGVERNDNSKLHLTGIKGSLRWWYEALVRGLGYCACDPTNDGCRLELSTKDKELIRENNLSIDQCAKDQICPACYLFGCTGWSGKFILKIMERDTDIPVKSLSSSGIPFDLHFKEEKKFNPAEEILLRMTMKIIVDYGAVGGKTVFKPSEIKAKNTKFHHRNFGILGSADDFGVPLQKLMSPIVESYLSSFKKRPINNYSEYPALNYFWFIQKKHIHRIEHNSIVNRSGSNPSNYNLNPDERDVFLGGFIARDKSIFPKEITKQYANTNAASKKIFSFYGTHTADLIERCFGYARNSMELEAVINLITSSTKIKRNDILTWHDLRKLI